MAAHHCMSHPCPLCYPNWTQPWGCQPVYTLPPPPTFVPVGCVCPPTSEKTCRASHCPRQPPAVTKGERA